MEKHIGKGKAIPQVLTSGLWTKPSRVETIEQQRRDMAAEVLEHFARLIREGEISVYDICRNSETMIPDDLQGEETSQLTGKHTLILHYHRKEK